MKHTLALVLMVVGSFGAFAEDILTREFVPLESFGFLKDSKIKKDSMSDRDEEYVAFRCLGLSGAMNSIHIIPTTEKDKEMVKFFKASKQAAAEYAFFIFNYTNQIDPDVYESSNPYFEKTKKVLIPLGLTYLELLSANKEKTGSYTDDDFLWGDMDACGSTFIMKGQSPEWQKLFPE